MAISIIYFTNRNEHRFIYILVEALSTIFLMIGIYIGNNIKN